MARHVAKFRDVTSSNSKVMGANTLNFEPIFTLFCKNVRGTPVPCRPKETEEKMKKTAKKSNTSHLILIRKFSCYETNNYLLNCIRFKRNILAVLKPM